MPRQVPTALKILRGNPGKRPLPVGEPKPEALTAPPGPPAHLKKVARKTWKEFTARLMKTRVLTEDDLYLVEQVCLYRAKLIGMANGGEVMCAAEMAQYRIALEAFGCSPASRAKIRVVDDKKDDKEAKLFGAA